MKKSLSILITTILLMGISGCSDSTVDNTLDNEDDKKTEVNIKEELLSDPYEEGEERDIVDLTTLSSTMVYGEVYNMMSNPKDYIGKIVKMEGKFTAVEDPETKKVYQACIIEDATACCAQGIEFVLEEEMSYPDEYPELETEVTVTGVFRVYEEDDKMYCHLIDSVMEVE